MERGLVAVGLVVASFIVGGAIRDFRISDRYVEVKGLAEREVAADLAIWPVNYQLAANSLDELRDQMEAADESVIAFLKLRGFEDSEITRNPPRITDQWIHAYGENTASQSLHGRTRPDAEKRQGRCDPECSAGFIRTGWPGRDSLSQLGVRKHNSCLPD